VVQELLQSFSASILFSDSDVGSVVDPDIFRENPVEAKHRKLARSYRNGSLQRDIKPTAKIRDELKVRKKKTILFHFFPCKIFIVMLI